MAAEPKSEARRSQWPHAGSGHAPAGLPAVVGIQRPCSAAGWAVCPLSVDFAAVPPPGTRELGEFHAFIVSDLHELQDLAGRSVLLLRIQNPWGRRCWQGPWREG